MEDRPGMACAQPTAPILVVEDNADVRDAWEALLEGEGYRVVSAASGREALRWLRSSEVMPALILLDLIMPGMNGWDFRAEQSQDETLASIPVIVVSADPLATLAKNAGWRRYWESLPSRMRCLRPLGFIASTPAESAAPPRCRS